MDDVGSAIIVPVYVFSYAVPLRLCAGEIDLVKAAAVGERIPTYVRDAVWDGYALKAAAVAERAIAYARDAVGDSYADKAVAIAECIAA